MNCNDHTEWPDKKPFALCLSHDIDQIYDREFFRILGTMNHLRRMILNGESGSVMKCVNRIFRMLFFPRKPCQEIKTIVEIEKQHGFRSTFYLLEDQKFNNLAGRYLYSDEPIKNLVRYLQENDCEVGLHAAYHNFNSNQLYKEQISSFECAFGFFPVGVRNHYLRHDGIATWSVQKRVGLKYDSSFGSNHDIGVVDDMYFPFFPQLSDQESNMDFVVIPMNIMDVSLFGSGLWDVEKKLEQAKQVAETIIRKGGVLCLNWHNTYFNEPEYQNWQLVYERLLSWLANQNPWNATAMEIAEYWVNHTRGTSK